ncbi:MAG: hypothetical protein AAGA54_03710 [Myxococcota bacterium]
MAALCLAIGSGCDPTAWIPGYEQGHTVTAFEVVPDPDLFLRATATVELGSLPRKFNRLALTSRCPLKGQSYVDTGWLPLVSTAPHVPGTTFSIDEAPFAHGDWDDALIAGDCDVWLTLRERVERVGPYQETLLGSRCHRDGVWGGQGCASLPSRGDAKPLTAASITMAVHAFSFSKSRRNRHSVRLKVEYGVEHFIDPAWTLRAEATCASGSETVTFEDGINGPKPFELRPGERARGFLPAAGSVKKTLSAEAEQCEVKLWAEQARADEEIQNVATFCLEPGEDARSGPCTLR